MEDVDPNSCLNYFRKLTALRKNNLALVYGKYTLLDKSNPKVYAYMREGENQKLLVMLNFSATDAQFDTGISMEDAKILLSNYSAPPKEKMLRPYEAVICQLP